MDLGSAAIRTRKRVEAGEYTTVEYEYKVGHPIDDTGYVAIAFRFASDFGTPQWKDSREPNFCSFSTSGDCRLNPRWDPKGYRRPWGQVLLLQVAGGFLDRDDRVRVTFGDTREGSPGWQMQTFCEKTFEFKTLVDPIATCQFRELQPSPVISIVPGEAVRTVCLAPSCVHLSRPFIYRIKREDRWGNPVARPQRKRHQGFTRPGVYRLEVEGLSGEGLVRSNPVEVDEGTTPGRYWADLHGQSEETVGTNSIKDYFLFARDYGGLDVAAHQGNDFQMSDEFWEYLNAVTASFNRDGRFVTFPGYEWSGNTPLGGDRNVWFAGEGGPIFRSSLEQVEGGRSRWKTASTANDLFQLLKSASGPEAFCAAHVGGRYADLRYHDPDLEWMVEVHSAWGTFEWIIEDSIRRGYRVGFCASSDGHKGRPGASFPGAGKFGAIGGLTCILAPRLNRASILEALRARHFYATTGNRSLITVECHAAGERLGMMGDIIQLRGDQTDLQLHITVEGTSALERVEVWNGLDLLGTLRPEAVVSAPGRRFQIMWSGAEVRGRGRLVRWDGDLTVSGNRIQEVTPVNFLNPNLPLRQNSGTHLAWKSNTTGGHSGMILTLEKPLRGVLDIRTVQKRVRYAIPRQRPVPRFWPCGGVQKQIGIRPLPESPGASRMDNVWPLASLRCGDNPIYIKAVQEDGHMAWSSPIYLVSVPA